MEVAVRSISQKGIVLQMNMTAKLTILIALAGTLAFSVFVSPAFAQAVETNSISVSADGITRTVTYVEADWGSPNWQLVPVLAHNHVKSVDSLADMAQSVGAVAAINGGYFNSYSDDEPQGTLEINGQYLVTLGATLMGITNDNHLVFLPGSNKSITGTVNGLSDWRHNWYAWGFNYNFDDNPKQIVIFTPAYGDETGMHDGTSVVVRQGKVAYAQQGNAYIPPDGYVIYFGPDPSASQYLARFQPGDPVSYAVSFSDMNGNQPDWSSVQSALSAGPMLVENGRVMVQPQAEGFTDPEVTEVASLRSFIGVTADNHLVMGDVPDVTVYQLAPVLQAFGLYNAMCLDDAASAGLWYKGQYLVTPGRDLADALALVYSENPVPRLMVDGRYVFAGEPPVLRDNCTLVPIRGVLQAMGATVTWDGSDSSITIERSGLNCVLAIGNKTATVNGVSEPLPATPRIINGTAYVPVRFIARILGETVNWDAGTYTVEIS